MLYLIDSHCHIHESSYPLDPVDVIRRAKEVGVKKIICVGTDDKSSTEAIKFSTEHDNAWAIVGVHPHEAKHGLGRVPDLIAQNTNSNVEVTKLIGIGEIGLDYFYNHSSRDNQVEIFNRQIELAIKHDLPISFHVREAFEDFWSIFDNFHGLRGVLHSYTDSTKNLERALERGLYIGVNGIATFNKNQEQEAMYRAIPIERLLLETDSPFLTPVPNRGKVNEPAFVADVARYLSNLYDQPIEKLTEITSQNTQKLFF